MEQDGDGERGAAYASELTMIVQEERSRASVSSFGDHRQEGAWHPGLRSDTFAKR